MIEVNLAVGECVKFGFLDVGEEFCAEWAWQVEPGLRGPFEKISASHFTDAAGQISRTSYELICYRVVRTGGGNG